MKKIFFFVTLLYMSQHLASQEIGYDVSFDQVFDNREFFSDFAFPQTIFGARINTSVCFELDSTQGFDAGMNYMYEYGSSINGIAPQLNLFYHFRGQNLSVALGSFPRRKRIDLPIYFLTDTLNYYRPNVEGAFFSYDENWGRFSGFIDWTGRVSEERRESFLVGLNSKLNVQKFYFQASFLMYHNARSYNVLDTVALQDNGIMSALIGYEAEAEDSRTFLNISGGMLTSYNRHRPESFEWGKGIISNIEYRYSIFGMKGLYYFGTPIDFVYGDPFFRTGNYGRLDVFVDPFKNPKIDSKIGWNFHFVPGEGIHNSQQVLITVKF